MAVKKSELYSSLWRSCDELRGGMDASQYKDYVLVLLFMKYVSDKYGGQKNALLDVPPGGSFADMVALKNDKEIGDKINKIIHCLALANDLTGVIDVADFNNEDKLGKGKEMVDRLTNLVSIFDTPALNFKGNRAEGDDILGDAYEYLMRHFATESGKSKGQFYTPAEVSRIMAKVIGISRATRSDQTIHDPACGSGSLLLKAHDEAKSATGLDLALYGQEIDNATKALATMNMILHDCPTAEVWQDNSLSAPYFKQADGGLKTFDFVVANPPFSTKAWSNGFNPAADHYNRFACGVPPAKNGDYAFLLHILATLKSTGKGAVILPHGVLFRGGAEATIRKNIVRRGYIKGIIGLPANLFYGTGIPACILVLDKEGAAERTGLFMMDAAKGFRKDGNKNRLRAQDIHKIVDTFNNAVETPKYSRFVPLAEIARNDFNLNLPRYIDSAEPEDGQNLDAHLNGGIPDTDLDALGNYWAVLPGVRAQLFQPSNRAGYSDLCVAAGEIKSTIFAHPEFDAFNQTVTARFARWRDAALPRLRAIGVGTAPKPLIEALSEELLATFRAAPLLDAYDVYQHLMTYWAETMQDDVYLIAAEGWVGANKLRRIVDDREKKTRETPDLVLDRQKYKADLIPPALVIDHYFAPERDALVRLEEAAAQLTQQLTEYTEEQGGEEGLLAQATDDKGGVNRAGVVSRLKQMKGEADADEEQAALQTLLNLMDREAAAQSKLKAAQRAMTERVLAKYPQMSEADTQTLAIEKKWLAALAGDVQTELDRVSQALTGRTRQLAERYATPLPRLTADVATLAARVEAHLATMGLSWK